jgi:hypothetical protein
LADFPLKIKYRTSSLTLFIIGLISLICRLVSSTLISGQIFYQGAKIDLNILEGNITDYPSNLQDLMIAYRITDLTGRLAFPILAYLIVRQVLISSDVNRFISILAFTAAASELIYDYLYFYSLFALLQQNMLLTIMVAVVAIVAMERYYDNKWIRILLSITAIVLAHFANLEEGGFGVSLMMLFYLFHEQKMIMLGFGVLISMPTITGPLAFIPIGLHDSDTNIECTPFIFIIYPVLLAILVLIRIFIF